MSALLATATAAKSGSTVVATVNGVSTTVQVARDLTVAAGDVLVVERIGTQWFALARAFAAAPVAPDNAPAPDPKPTVTRGSLVVSPVFTGSYRSSGWRTDRLDVLQGQYGGNQNHTGCAFYGTKPRSLAGATVTDAKIRVRRRSGGVYAAQTSTLWLVTQATKPAGAPTRTSSTTGPSLAVNATNNAFDIPNSWVQAMVDGTAGGLAVFDSGASPYIVFAGKASWSPAWTLTITWQRG